MAMGVYAGGVEETLEDFPVGQDIPERSGVVRKIVKSPIL